MIRKKEEKHEPIAIDLTGPEGNAFALIGLATRFAKHLGRDGEAICQEMMSGDYENLLLVFDREFGDFVILEK